MKKDNIEQKIYNVNPFYFRLHNIGTSINEQIDFIYYTEDDKWRVYGKDFNDIQIDIATLSNEEVNTIKNWDIITKKKLITFLIDNKQKIHKDNEHNIFSNTDIIEFFEIKNPIYNKKTILLEDTELLEIDLSKYEKLETILCFDANIKKIKIR